MVDLEADVRFMARALLLAERGRGQTTPNPIVGAVVVAPGGVVVGQGAHLRAGGPHAEVVALDRAGARARGATLYSTLEPCSHTGRTGPCVERIVAAGVRRVVGGTQDPNPLVAGRGFAYLRAHNVAVTEGVARADALAQLAPYVTWMTRRRPFVTVKVAASSDGFVGRPGERVRLTGPVADRYFHRQRAEIDAIAVGADTVLVDDPLLTPRGAYRFRPLVRVIVDWRGRVLPAARVFSTLEAGPVIMVVSPEAARAARGRLAPGVEIDVGPARDLHGALERLAARELVSVLVEGGPTLQDALFEAGLVDRIQWVVAPGRLGRGIRQPRLLDGLAVATARTTGLGRDVLYEFDVHRTD